MLTDTIVFRFKKNSKIYHRVQYFTYRCFIVLVVGPNLHGLKQKKSVVMLKLDGWMNSRVVAYMK